VKSYTAYIDGGSRGNPGTAGYGVYFLDQQGKALAEISEPLGIRTNNQAEYSALIAALEFAHAHQYFKLRIFADSELLVNQINGTYKVKNPDLQILYGRARHLIAGLESFSIQHVPREQNREADRLANLAMDHRPSRVDVEQDGPFVPTRVTAVYHDGCLRLSKPLPFPEGTRFNLILQPADTGGRYKG
jgi:ribonuclease HI